MAYTKTTWVDNTTPIDSTNLNKIEQGIYDNSLVADAVNVTVKPTGDTYKSQTLTEGQITEVLGVSDIILKGDTVQDGTPTPSAPVDINVVSGSNVIITSNKNLLVLPNRFLTLNNVSLTIENQKITVNGTPNTTPTTIFVTLNQPIKLKANEKIKISLNNATGIGSASNYVSFRLRGTVDGVENDNIKDVYCTNSNAKDTFTATGETIINQIGVRGNTNVTFNNFILYPQIEYGETATTYEAHQGKELLLDLPVENLFNKNAVNETSGFLDTNGTIVSNAGFKVSDYIDISSITNLTISGNSGNGENIAFYDSNKDFVSSVNMVTSTSKTVSVPNNAKYFRGTIKNDKLDYYQVEKGSKANAYTTYGTTPIELCKVGDYQDYFYKNNGKWYLHKEIEKVVLDGSEYWDTNSYDTNFYRYILSVANSKVTSNTGTEILALSNQFDAVSSNDVIYTHDKDMVGIISLNRIAVSTIDANLFVLSNFKTWLSTHNLIVYYVRETATNTEITDTALKAQLEATYNAPLYEQTNITQENNDLPIILDITACKDNINGIKAWIRK